MRLWKVIQEDMENLEKKKTTIISKEVELVIKKLPMNKAWKHKLHSTYI